MRVACVQGGLCQSTLPRPFMSRGDRLVEVPLSCLSLQWSKLELVLLRLSQRQPHFRLARSAASAVRWVCCAPIIVRDSVVVSFISFIRGMHTTVPPIPHVPHPVCGTAYGWNMIHMGGMVDRIFRVIIPPYHQKPPFHVFFRGYCTTLPESSHG